MVVIVIRFLMYSFVQNKLPSTGMRGRMRGTTESICVLLTTTTCKTFLVRLRAYIHSRVKVSFRN